jgi:hypothetical protein
MEVSGVRGEEGFRFQVSGDEHVMLQKFRKV